MSFVLRSALGVATKQRFLIRVGPSTSNAYFAKSSEPRVSGYIVFFRSYSSSKDDPSVEEIIPEDAALIDTEYQVPAKIAIPDHLTDLPIVTLNRHPLFPGYLKNVMIIKDEELKKIIEEKIKNRVPYVGLFLKRNDEDQEETVSSINELYPVGTFAQVVEMINHHKPVLSLLLTAHHRIRILEPIDISSPSIPTKKINVRRFRAFNQIKRKGSTEKPSEPTETPTSKRIIMARTEKLKEDWGDYTKSDGKLKAIMQSIVENIREVVKISVLIREQIHVLLRPGESYLENPDALCNLVGTIVSADSQEKQKLLEITDVMERLLYALELMEKEKKLVEIKTKIGEEVNKKISEQHKKYMLQEQLKAIKKELGLEKDDKQSIIDKMEERLKDLIVPEYAMKVIKEEQNKLQFLDPHSSEFSVSRNYLDWLTQIPWGKMSGENMDLVKAATILDEDHYGMKDVKERILEFIAVGILKNKVGGKILCFHGPPGVGKTSIAKSIARALNREYFRFSVGGMTDVAEIKGHRRTYIGAMPGKMIQCLKKVQTENPLVLIDEVDKIGGAGFHGDPASALLELLDPEQNANFLDHFLDVPVDLSKVLFICTANTIDSIPSALKDRMELIEVSGYVAEEKLSIAQSYLIPQCRRDCALPEEKLEIKQEALDTLIKQYCRESGVRNLMKHIERIFRKAAYQITGAKEGSEEGIIVVGNDNLQKFVGRPKFTSDRLYEITPPGVIMGLAWTSMGGSALYIEASLRRKYQPHAATNPDKISTEPDVSLKDQQKPISPEGSLEATGHLGDVMKESMRTSYTVAKNILAKRDPTNDFLELAHIHVHVPEGAVPKDGPSAGVTITSALLSLAMGMPARQNIAMTGEISLTGKVLPVGGIKEKIIAAKRAGVNTVILPEENKKDVDDLPEFIKNDVETHFVKHYNDVFDILFAEKV
uniref:Lon protease homolog n=1 Tax=Acrobeloides nanus TaxID=290746 RepID=A0A914BX28_9BILA